MRSEAYIGIIVGIAVFIVLKSSKAVAYASRVVLCMYWYLVTFVYTKAYISYISCLQLAFYTFGEGDMARTRAKS